MRWWATVALRESESLVGTLAELGHTADVLLARPFLFCFCLLALSLRANGAELPHPRAPRLLRLVDASGAALKGDCFAPRFAFRGNGLFFQRDIQNTRQTWFAAPIRSAERYPAWRAVPILRSRSPLRFSEAISFQKDNTVFVAAGNSDQKSALDTQLLLIKAKDTTLSRTLWRGRERLAHLALSPDARTLVFTRYFRDGQGRETPQLWRIDPNAKAKPTLILKSARRAFWINGSTLVFERLLGERTAFYAFDPLGKSAPRLLMHGSGEGAALGEEAGIVFAARGSSSILTSLYLLASDGSGLRIMPESVGARHPVVSGDGRCLAFDAPNPQTGARNLWLARVALPDSATLNPIAFRGVKNRAVGAACPLEPMPLPPPAEPPTPPIDPVRAEKALPTPLPVPTPAAQPTATPTKAPPKPSDDKADMDVAGTLASVPAGAKMRVTFWAKNRGTRNWTADDVRIVMRWVDYDTGTRRRWSYNWMRGVVPPLGQVRIPLEVTVPTQKGRYKIIYSLIRLPSKKAPVTPPSYDSAQSAWPGEFAATAFAVNVNAPASPN